MKYALLPMLAAMLFCTVHAHGGRTAKDGCHNQRATGTRHCHHKGAQFRRSVTREKTDMRDCSQQLYCGQMTSCEQAKFYLEVCGHKARDSDNDGMPCEKTSKSSTFPCPHRKKD